MMSDLIWEGRFIQSSYILLIDYQYNAVNTIEKSFGFIDCD